MAKAKVVIGDKTYTINFEDFLIDEADLDGLLCRQPEDHGRYGRIMALAKSKVERLEYALEELEANLDTAIRDKRNAMKGKEGEEKLTEGRIKQLIISNPTRLAKINEILEAKEQFEISYAALQASAQKKDCLISIGANRRAQYDTDLSIREKPKGKK
jgi:hypothetical protein